MSEIVVVVEEVVVVLGMNAALCEGGTSSLPGEEGKEGGGREGGLNTKDLV